jgi:hypothetical protein
MITLDRIARTIKRAINSNSGNQFRVEWSDRTGGTAKTAWGISEGGTLTSQHRDIKGFIVKYKGPAILTEGRNLYKHAPKIIILDIEENLSNKENFSVFQKIKNFSYSGVGAFIGDDFAPTVDPEWTVNQWKNYYFMSGETRYIIDSNSDVLVACDTKGETPPVGAITGELLSLAPWYPTFNVPLIGSFMSLPWAEGLPFQAILCTSIPYKGDQV